MGLFDLGYGSQESESSSGPWKAVRPALRTLYGGAEDQFKAGPSPFTGQAIDYAQDLIPGMMPYAEEALPAWQRQLGGGSFGGYSFDPSVVNELSQGQGGGFGTLENLQQAGPNPYLDMMAGSGLDQMSQNFQRNIIPSIRRGSATSGGLGGSRQGIAEANAANDLMTQGTNFLTGLYGGQYAGDQNRRLAAGSQQNADQIAALNAMRGFGGMSDTAVSQGLAYGPQALQTSLAPVEAARAASGIQWDPYNQYREALGPIPQAGSSSGSGVNYSMGFGGK